MQNVLADIVTHKAPKMSAPTDKQVKASTKEGGKKGQDLAGMNAMGGVKFFSVAVESAAGRHELMDAILDGMNKEVDETADDRKGGAGDIGKTLLYADDKVLLVLCHVPENLRTEIDQREWFEAITTPVGAKEVPGGSPGVLRATLDADAEKGRFPLKDRDVAINASFEYLVKKGLVRADESDDDTNYAENAGIEW